MRPQQRKIVQRGSDYYSPEAIEQRWQERLAAGRKAEAVRRVKPKRKKATTKRGGRRR